MRMRKGKRRPLTWALCSVAFAGAVVLGVGETRAATAPVSGYGPSEPSERVGLPYRQPHTSDPLTLYTMNADGSDPSRLFYSNTPLDGGVSPAWSPLGQRIVFVHWDDHANDPGADIFAINADGRGATDLTRTFDEYAVEQEPSWSPDGSQIAYDVGVWWIHDPTSSICVMNADGTARRCLNPGLYGADYAPAWSPDGSHIAFAHYDWSTQDFDIYVMSADGSGAIDLSNDPASDDFSPSWSPDGSRLAFSRSPFLSCERDIYVMNADGSGQTDLSNDPASQDYWPSWSPDGSRIAFSRSAACGGASDVYVMKADGNGRTDLTNNPANDSHPSWSPDGARIVFSSNRSNPASATTRARLRSRGVNAG